VAPASIGAPGRVCKLVVCATGAWKASLGRRARAAQVASRTLCDGTAPSERSLQTDSRAAFCTSLGFAELLVWTPHCEVAATVVADIIGSTSGGKAAAALAVSVLVLLALLFVADLLIERRPFFGRASGHWSTRLCTALWRCWSPAILSRLWDRHASTSTSRCHRRTGTLCLRQAGGRAPGAAGSRARRCGRGSAGARSPSRL